MALRISKVTEGAAVTLKVDGRLSGADTEELLRAGFACSGRLTLDLAGMLFADDVGASVLKNLQARGAVLQNVPPYIALVLELEDGGAPVTAGVGRVGS